MKKIMICVGEASGDMHGADVAKALRTIEPDIEILGMGGSLMRQAGVGICYDIADIGVFGLLEIIKKLPKLRRLRRLLAGIMDSERPDALVVIDYGGFNIGLAEIAKNKGIPVVYYIPPKVWVWGRGRAKRIAEAVRQVAVIFPFEVETYKEAGAKVDFVGNPLVDIVKPSMSKEAAYKYFDVDPAKPLVLLMPGSRRQEIENLLPVMLKSAEEVLKKLPDCQFFLPVASTISREILQNIISGSPIKLRLADDKHYDLMNIAQVAIAASGTVTLEAALMGLPSVIIYKVAPLTYFIGKRLVKIPNVGLPNIVAGKRVMPELLQDDATPANIAVETLLILTDKALRDSLMQEIGNIRRNLGEGGAVRSVAEMILEIAKDAHGGTK